MASKLKHLYAVRQTLKDLLYMMKDVDAEMKKNMEIAIDSFVDESVSTYTKNEIAEKFSTSEKAYALLDEFIEMKANGEKVR